MGVVRKTMGGEEDNGGVRKTMGVVRKTMGGGEEDNGGGEDYATWRQQGRQWGW